MKDEQVEERLIQPLQYVIAVDNSECPFNYLQLYPNYSFFSEFGIREIAFRYASGFSTPKFRKRRKIDDFIKETLSLPVQIQSIWNTYSNHLVIPIGWIPCKSRRCSISFSNQ